MLRVLQAEAVRFWISYRRYPADFIGNILILSLSFYALLAGTHFMAGPAVQFGDRVDVVIIGYWLWTMLLFALGGLAADLQTEALTGTLEQLALCRHDLARIVVFRAMAALGFNVVTTSLLLGTMLLFTGRTLRFPPGIVFPLMTVLCGAYALSLAMGALALLYKRVSHLLQVSQVLLMFLVMAQFESWSRPFPLVGDLLPIVPAAAMLRGLMVRGHAFDFPQFGIALANSLTYFAVALLLFRRADDRARRHALLGHY